MPFYEYQCAKCGHEEEVLQKISDKPLKKCSECGKSAMKKMVSAAAFRLRGGGWYETDFKSGNKKNIDKPDNKPADKKSTDKKKESAPAKKAQGSSAPGSSAPGSSTTGSSTTSKKQPK